MGLCSNYRKNKINERDKLFKKFKKSRFHVDKDNYKEARNEVQQLICTKKKAYFESKLTENIGNPKKLWKRLKSLGLKFERSISNINCLENDKSANFDVKDIAKGFSAYFSNLAENLVRQLPNPSNKYGALSVAQYYSHLGLTKKFDLLPPEKYYVLKILRDIGNSKAAGIERLLGRFLKDGADVLAKPVTDICNLSIPLNKFPGAFKLAKVKPIFKKDRKTNVSNYRPISLLPILSKVIEKVVHEQTTKFLNDNNTFYKYQSGFRSDHSTGQFLPFLCHLGPLLLLIYVNDMSQTVECYLYLYADDSCLLFQHKSVSKIKKQLTKDFSNICDWFVDNKHFINFGEDKTKSILFSSKRNLKLVEEFDIRYKEIKIKQNKHVIIWGVC